MKFHSFVFLLVFQLNGVIASDDLTTVTGGLNLGDSLVSALYRKPHLTTLLGDKPNPESEQTTLFEQIGPNDLGINAATYMFKRRRLYSLILNLPVTNEKQVSEAYGKLFRLANLSDAGSMERAVDEQSITICFRHKIGEIWITIPWAFGATSANATLQLLHKDEVDHARKVVREHLPQNPKNFDQQVMDFVSKLNQTNNTKIQSLPQIDSLGERLSVNHPSTNKTTSTALGSAVAMHVGTLAIIGGLLLIIMLGFIWLLLRARQK